MSVEVNLQGIKPHKEIINALIDYKQGKLLEDNYHTIKTRYAKEMLLDFDKYQLSPEFVEERIKNDMIQKTAKEICLKLLPQIEKKEDNIGGFIDYSLEFLLIQRHELKHIIDYCIRKMPLEVINEIKTT